MCTSSESSRDFPSLECFSEKSPKFSCGSHQDFFSEIFFVCLLHHHFLCLLRSRQHHLFLHWNDSLVVFFYAVILRLLFSSFDIRQHHFLSWHQNIRTENVKRKKVSKLHHLYHQVMSISRDDATTFDSQRNICFHLFLFFSTCILFLIHPRFSPPFTSLHLFWYTREKKMQWWSWWWLERRCEDTFYLLLLSCSSPQERKWKRSWKSVCLIFKTEKAFENLYRGLVIESLSVRMQSFSPLFHTRGSCLFSGCHLEITKNPLWCLWVEWVKSSTNKSSRRKEKTRDASAKVTKKVWRLNLSFKSYSQITDDDRKKRLNICLCLFHCWKWKKRETYQNSSTRTTRRRTKNMLFCTSDPIISRSLKLFQVVQLFQDSCVFRWGILMWSFVITRD